MRSPRDHAQALLHKAANDLLAARAILAAGEAFDTACFHAQQTVEKCLKFEPSDDQAAEATRTAEEVYELIKRVIEKRDEHAG
jgi:HEPN domain-containing protein